MVRREVVVEVLTPDEICFELYGAAKGALLLELQHEHRRIRALSKYRRQGAARAVPGPTFQALTWPEYRHYLERGDHADS
jgi:hypothetical protein